MSTIPAVVEWDRPEQSVTVVDPVDWVEPLPAVVMAN